MRVVKMWMVRWINGVIKEDMIRKEYLRENRLRYGLGMKYRWLDVVKNEDGWCMRGWCEGSGSSESLGWEWPTPNSWYERRGKEEFLRLAVPDCLRW